MLLSCVGADAQRKLDISICWSMATSNSDYIIKGNLIDGTVHYSLLNASKGIYPKKVITTSVASSPSALSQSNNVMNIVIGGAKVGGNSTVKAKLDDRQQFLLRDRVNNIYFSSILLQKKVNTIEQTQMGLLNLFRTINRIKCDEKTKEIYSGQLNSYITELNNRKHMHISIYNEYMRMLSLIIGYNIPLNDRLVEPEIGEFISKMAIEMNISTSGVSSSLTSLINPTISSDISIKNISNLSELPKINSSFGISKTDKGTSLQEIQKKMFNIDVEEQKKNYKDQIRQLVTELDRLDKVAAEQMEVIKVSLVKLETGSLKMENLIKLIEQIIELNFQQTAVMVQLMLEVDQYNMMYG